MVKKKNTSKRLVTFKKKMASKSDKVSIGIILLIIMSVVVVSANSRLFATFGVGTEWTGAVGIEGLYLPTGTVINNYFASANGDNFEIDLDGSGIGYGLGSQLGAGNIMAVELPFGDLHQAYGYSAATPDTFNPNSVPQYFNESRDTYLTKDYANWGAEGYFESEWYPDMKGWYTMYPNLDVELNRLIQITNDSTTIDVKMIDSGLPSAVGSDSIGNYFESFNYRFELSVSLHADEVASWAGLANFWATFDGAENAYFTLYEFAKIENMYVILSAETNANNASIFNIISDIQTFGDAKIQYFEWDSSFSREVSRADVQDELNNMPPAPLLTLRVQELRINENVLMSGLDSTAGLPVVDVTYTPELSNPDKMYFAFPIDSIAVPGYYYKNMGIVIRDLYEGHNLWDVKVTFPMMLSITLNYNIDTGIPNTLIPNNNGTMINLSDYTFGGGGEVPESTWQMEVANATGWPVEWVLPIVLIFGFLIYRKFGR